MNSLIGQTLGQYQIVEQIGKGGMATVFKAYQPGLDRYVAIKVLPAYYAHEEGFSERFIREAKAIARLDHPNILPVYDFGQADGLSYLVMKYVAAGTLKDRLGAPLTPQVALETLKQVAAALDHAHDRGILHRDVKPANILIDDKGWVYLSDFGLAKMVEGTVQLTGTGVGVGTPAYMSPEQGQGLSVDARTDVYALGVILYEMLTGRVPYEAETPMAVVVKHITSPLPMPRVLNPSISIPVERVILKALAKVPEDRFDRAGALAVALDKALAQVEPEKSGALPPYPSPALALHRRPAPISPVAAPAPPVSRVPAHQAPAPPRKSGAPTLAIAGVAGLMIVLIVGLIVVLLLTLRGGAASDGIVNRDGSEPTGSPVPPESTPSALPPTLVATSTLLPQVSPEATAPSFTPATTDTPLPMDTRIPTDTPVPTDTPSLTPTPIRTDTPRPTATLATTDTPTPTATPVPTDTPTNTPTRPVNSDTGYRPSPIFETLWNDLGAGQGPLGYPLAPAVTDRNYAKQYFTQGFMYWWQSPTLPEPIWVVSLPDPDANSGTTWARYDNTWDSSKPLFPPDCPEASEPLGPVSGFGVTWCYRPGVKEMVGAPREREAGSGDVYPKGAVQFFQQGVMFENPRDRHIWALVDGVGWQRASY